MRSINFNEFKKLGLEITIGEKLYKIESIPYPIESDIYANLVPLHEVFADITKMNDEWKEKITNWIWETFNFDQNKNGEISKQELFNNLGMTERIALMTLLVQFITDRMKGMQDIFGNGEKKI